MKYFEENRKENRNYNENGIDAIREKISCIAVIKKDVPLRQIGKNVFLGRCPKCGKPTLAVDKDKYICVNRNCYMGGDAFSWLMKGHRKTLREACDEMIADFDLPNKPGGRNAKVTCQNRALDTCEKACQQFERNLPNNFRALSYLLNRGLSADIIKKFRLGFDDTSPIDDTDARSLSEAGIFTEGYGRKRGHSHFRWRVIFPIFDISGRVIAFGGRITEDNPNKAKYINSPGTVLFDKSRVLYGMNFAKDSKRNGLILCEGYMDVIAMHAAGFDNAVAALGTALTQDNIAELKRHTDHLCLMFDSDEAGQKATLKAINELENSGIAVYVAILSGAKDPDEYIKKFGADAMQKVLHSCISADVYLVRKALGNSVPGTPEADEKITEFLNSLSFSRFQRCIRIYACMKKTVAKRNV